MNKGNKGAKVTNETKAESSRLKALWDNRKDKISQVEFGEKYDIGSQSSMNQFLNGVTPISMKAAVGFAKGLGCQISDFSPRLVKEAAIYAEVIKTEIDNEFLPVKMLNIELSAGHGTNGDAFAEELGVLNFKRSFMRKQGIKVEDAAIVKIRGESMEPTIADGAAVLLNLASTSPRSGNIYAFIHEGELFIKRFFLGDGVWVARSDNFDRKKHRDIIIDGSGVGKILGRAIWVGMNL